MQCWKFVWHHDFDDEPSVIYSEIGSDGYEVRKVVGFRDGRLLKADESHEGREVGLSEVPVGDIEDVARQPEFSASAISSAEFRAVWDVAQWGA
ncbi:DUF6881 domain-containing protein [Streptomyces orinoci]|uniref:DUF6881 domain-containing protein n=1 Tax=Streptomyces orinoci TaxID=67339 RepID=A0ABV3JVE7_STRON